MSELHDYKGHKLLDDGLAADAYWEVNGHDILDDIREAQDAVSSGKSPRYTKIYGNLYVALRQNFANRCKEEGEKDPDVDGKTAQDFRQEIGIHDFLNADFGRIMTDFISGGKKEEAAETPSPEAEESPAPSSTPSPSPKEGSDSHTGISG